MHTTHEDLCLCMRRLAGKEFTIKDIYNIAQRLGVKVTESTIRYRLQRFCDFGVIEKRTVNCNAKNIFFMKKGGFNRLCGFGEEYKAIRKETMKKAVEKTKKTKSMSKDYRQSKHPKMIWGQIFKGAPGETVVMREDSRCD